MVRVAARTFEHTRLFSNCTRGGEQAYGGLSRIERCTLKGGLMSLDLTFRDVARSTSRHGKIIGDALLVMLTVISQYAFALSKYYGGIAWKLARRYSRALWVVAKRLSLIVWSQVKPRLRKLWVTGRRCFYGLAQDVLRIAKGHGVAIKDVFVTISGEGVRQVPTRLRLDGHQLRRLVNMRIRAEARPEKANIFWTTIHYKNCPLRWNVRDKQRCALNHWFNKYHELYANKTKFSFVPSITYEDEINNLARINTTMDELLLPDKHRIAS
jgi:hypothetical protein